MNINETRGYVLNGTTVLPLQSTSPPTRGPRDPRKVRRRIRMRFLGFFLAPVIVGGGIFLATWILTPPTRDVEILPGSAIVSIDEQDVAVVVYADTSRPGMFEPLFQTRATAIRLTDGKALWDQRLNEDLANEAIALAGDSSRVYVGTDDGLVILDAATGAIEAQGTGIAGLGADAVLSASAYGYDSEANAVVALAATGGFVQIPLGSLEAQPADAAVASRWQGTLSASAFLDTSTLTRLVDTAIAPDGTTFAIEPVSEAVGRDALVISSPDRTTVSRTDLVDAEILPASGLEPQLGLMLDSGQFLEGDFTGIDADDIEALLEAASRMTGETVLAPAASGSGFLLVQHRESVNADRTLLSSVEIATGRLVDTVEMQTDAVRAMTGPSGTTAVIAAAPDSWFPNTLLVLEEDGALREVAVGVVPWWVAPLR
ncbi:PA2928 family protein [Microbacterium sp. EST19A]|uniref:PA2928 family protein n=1 Tax=Microbacterium sp. EST19A TaxID=2862681 RepID=UPI001CBCC3D3|nr:PA2928 family protein [Microbacterium sp. EST19A]